MPEIRINDRGELMALARELGVRPDWHEPDNQEVTAEVSGHTLDNAGFWGGDHEVRWMTQHGNTEGVELYVTLKQNGEPVAEVNLATLFAWATGYEADATAVGAVLRDRAFTAAEKLEAASVEAAKAARELRDLANTEGQ